MKTNEAKKSKQAWPTKDAMNQVYENKLWGDNESAFYSGDGSHHADIVNPYLDAVRSFLSSCKPLLTVCDLGCGDFNVGKELVPYAKQYIALDIVEDLIKHNQIKFQAKNLEFYCLDISTDELPTGDCVILRQVLQHLSNVEIQSIVSNLVHYKYVILTEHIPSGEFEANIDIISGQGIRLKKKSGVNIMASPFNFKTLMKKELCSFELGNGKGGIVTTLYQVF